jgi:hypothetical protein
MAAAGKQLVEPTRRLAAAFRAPLHKKKAGHEALPANPCTFLLPERGFRPEKPP